METSRESVDGVGGVSGPGPDVFRLPHIPFRAQVLAALTIFGANLLLEPSVEAAPAAPVERPSLPLGPITVRDWELNVQGMEEVKITNQHGNTLYAFIKGELRNQAVFPVQLTRENEEPIVMALVKACERLNPGLDLNDFESIRDQRIFFPVDSILDYQAEGMESSEKNLVDLAEMDGYRVDKKDERDRMYAEALKAGVELGDMWGSYRAKGDKKSPEVLLQDAYEGFSGAKQCFVIETRESGCEDRTGSAFAYADVLRDAALQAERDPSAMENIHYTGRAINISDGRFMVPSTCGGDLKEVTWSKNPEARTQIGLLRQAIEECFSEGSNTAVYHNKKGGFYDVYFGKQHTVKLSF